MKYLYLRMTIVVLCMSCVVGQRRGGPPQQQQQQQYRQGAQASGSRQGSSSNSQQQSQSASGSSYSRQGQAQAPASASRKDKYGRPIASSGQRPQYGAQPPGMASQQGFGNQYNQPEALTQEVDELRVEVEELREEVQEAEQEIAQAPEKVANEVIQILQVHEEADEIHMRNEACRQTFITFSNALKLFGVFYGMIMIRY